jgi:hypothetical protein
MKSLLFCFIPILFLTSCVTTKKVERYLEKHPELIERVFIFQDVHDTTIVVKDSLVVEKLTDTLYQWFSDFKYIDRPVTRWQIKEVLKPCKDSIVIVDKKIFVDRYKDAYEAAKKDRDATEKMYRWWQRGALITWAWIVLIGGVFYIIKRK